MRFHFTKHAKEKFSTMRLSGFLMTQKRVKEIIVKPIRRESRPDGTFIAMARYDTEHVI